MSNKLFTNREIKILANNPYVKSVTNKGITYNDQFKHLFIAEYEKGKSSIDIFEEYGFDIDVLGRDRILSSGKRWRATYRRNGVSGYKIIVNQTQVDQVKRIYL